MKQHITKSQLNELSKKHSDKLFDWLINKGYIDFKSNKDDTLITIGQMIEFLGDDWWKWLEQNADKSIISKHKGELCDALWEAVKYKLKNV